LCVAVNDTIVRQSYSGAKGHFWWVIFEFAEAYQEERPRLANNKRMKWRSQIENEPGQLQQSIDRVRDNYLSERIPVDVVGPKLKRISARSPGGGKHGSARGGENSQPAPALG
jgi:hypothetical protein